MVMLKINNAMLKMLPFIRILYLNQQSSILRCQNLKKRFQQSVFQVHISP